MQEDNIETEGSELISEKEALPPVPKASLTPPAKGLAILLSISTIWLVASLFGHLKQVSSKKESTMSTQQSIVAKPAPSLLTPIPQSSIAPTKRASDAPLFSLPTGWESVKTLGDTVNYQLAIRPKGEGDSPIVLNVYNDNSGMSFSEFVDTKVGNGYEEHVVTGDKGVYIKKGGYESYYFVQGNTYYELIAITGNTTRHAVFEQIHTSFQGK